jgi:N utilization substance protein A
VTRIKYDMNLMKYISLFESLTNTKVKDCVANEKLLFIVQEGHIGKAVGKQGINVKKIEGILKKDIRIVEFSENLIQFIQNMIYPLRASNIEEDQGTVTITGPDTKTKGLMIGREGKNLNYLKDIVKRHFSVEDIKVV